MTATLPKVIEVEDTPRKRVLIYCRTSGDDRERDSMSNQEQECLRYAEAHNYEVIGVLKEDSRGVSGAELNAPELKKAISLAEQGRYDIFLSRDIERFSRKYLKSKLIELELEGYGVKLEFVWDYFTDDPDGELWKNLRYAFAERERKRSNRRLVQGRRSRVAQGSAIFHGHPPFGFSCEKINKLFVPKIVEEEAEIVRLIFKLYVEDGLHMRAITRWLNKENVPTCFQLRQNNRFGKNNNSKWGSGTIKNILSNPVYIGKWYYGKKANREEIRIEKDRVISLYRTVRNSPDYWIEVSVPAIVSEEIWEKAQKRLAENQKPYGRKPTLDYLLGKRVWCECGRKATSTTHFCSGKLYGYYVICYDENCPHRKYFKLDLIDDLAWEWLKSIIKNKEKLKKKVEDFVLEMDEFLKPTYKRLNYLYDMREKDEEVYSKLLNRWVYLDEFDQKMMLPQKELLKKNLEDIVGEIKKLEDEKAEYEYLKAEFESGWDTTAYIWADQQNSMADWFLEDLDNNFEAKVDYIQKYDIRGTIVERDGAFHLHLKCRFDETLLKLCNNTP